MTLSAPNLESKGEMSCSGIPKTLFPACSISSSAASYTQKGGLTSTGRASPPPRVLWKPALQVHCKLREVEGNGQGLLIFLAESHACVGKMEFASTCGIIPGANFSRGHPSLPQARAEWVPHAPQKSRSGHSRAGSANSVQGLISCPSVVEFEVPCCSLETLLLSLLFPLPWIQC